MRLGSGSGERDRGRRGAKRRNIVGFWVSKGKIFIFFSIEPLKVGVGGGGGGGEVVEEEREEGEKREQVEESIASGEEEREGGDEEGGGRSLRHR